MDLHLAVAVTMLPAARSRTATVFKALRQQPALSLTDVVEALGIPLSHEAGAAAAAGGP